MITYFISYSYRVNGTTDGVTYSPVGETTGTDNIEVKTETPISCMLDIHKIEEDIAKEIRENSDYPRPDYIFIKIISWQKFEE